MKVGEIYSEIVVRDVQYKQAMSNAKTMAQGTTRALDVLARTSKWVFFGATAAMIGFIKSAADVEEMESKFEAVFKDQAMAAKEFAEVLSKRVNRSILDIMDQMSGFQDTFVPMGFARDEARELSQTLTQLTVDLGSFYNKAEPEVLRDMQSALVGNHETVRKYGIVITQARLDQELLNMGFKGGAKNATEQAKVMARLNILLGSTKDAHGDAARTSESFTNQMKGLWGEIKETSAIIGKALLPSAKMAVVIFRRMSPSIETVRKRMQGLTLYLKDVARFWINVYAHLETAVLNWQDTVDLAFGRVKLWTRGLAADMKFYFGQEIPRFLMVFGRNMFATFKAVAASGEEVFLGLTVNIGRMFLVTLPKYIKSMGKNLDLAWGAVTAGFKLKLEGMPGIAKRELSILEKAIGAGLDMMSARLGRKVESRKLGLEHMFGLTGDPTRTLMDAFGKAFVEITKGAGLEIPDIKVKFGREGAKKDKAQAAAFVGLEDMAKKIQLAVARREEKEAITIAKEQTKEAKKQTGLLGELVKKSFSPVGA